MQFINKHSVKSKYQDLNVRIIVSIAAAFFICAQSNDKDFSELMLTLTYYIALLVSAVIAFILFEMVHRLNILLDKKLPWKESPIIRTLSQLLFGIVVPAYAAYAMAAVYYDFFDYDIKDTGYEKHLYGPIKGYICLINLYYNWDIFYKKTPQLPAQTTEPTIKPLYIVETAPLDIALIYLQDKVIFAMDSKNKLVDDWKYGTIKASLNALPANQYIELGRNLVVRGDIIEAVKRVDRMLSVKLNDPFEGTYVVSKGRVAAFREFGEQNDVKWWDKKARKFQ